MGSSVVLILAGVLLAAPSPAQTLGERVRAYLERANAAGTPFVSISAASGTSPAAADSLASIFGNGVAAATVSASAPYPDTLPGVRIQVVDSAGAARTTRLLFVSPGQINYLLPAGLKPGAATLNLTTGNGTAMSAPVAVQSVAPALFTANGNGEGVVAATATRSIIGSQLSGPVDVFRCGTAPLSCVSVPIDPGIDAPVSVTLYATGIRGRSGDPALALTIGGQTIAIGSITSADDSGPMAGVDEVTFVLPLTLRSAGEVSVVLTVDGVASNPALINIQ